MTGKETSKTDAARFNVSAKAIQRAFRIRQTIYKMFGADLFADSCGQRASYGDLVFEGGGILKPFIRVSSSSSIPQLAQFLHKYWRLPRPELVMTITGGAQDFHLTQNQRDCLERGAHLRGPRVRASPPVAAHTAAPRCDLMLQADALLYNATTSHHEPPRCRARRSQDSSPQQSRRVRGSSPPAAILV